ncbi:hypothetical protein [Salinicola endophyticus]|uniref:hypothetical protein n=1 Tax=Salinicola endophyticus TaxID=1949083 RepID=UPI001300335E|nr:hypothetical protein [Salinicola endophyticus]
MTTITHAFCLELDRIVTVDEARFEFLSLSAAKRNRFNYLCTNLDCRQAGVRVFGVNDHRPLEDTEVYKDPHFRKSRDTHAPGCPWETEAITPIQGDDEPEEEFLQRAAKAKISDFIERFTPPSAKGAKDQAGNGDGKDVSSVTSQPPNSRNPGERHNEPGMRSTTVLDRLVTSYRQALKRLSSEELRSLQLQVVGVGRMRLVDYFKAIRYCSLETDQRVIFGGARFIHRFGKGVKFEFYDKLKHYKEGVEIGRYPVTLYISPRLVEAARHRNYFEEILKEPEKRRYFTIYALGHLTFSDKHESFSLVVDDLKSLSLLRGPDKEP